MHVCTCVCMYVCMFLLLSVNVLHLVTDCTPPLLVWEREHRLIKRLVLEEKESACRSLARASSVSSIGSREHSVCFKTENNQYSTSSQMRWQATSSSVCKPTRKKFLRTRWYLAVVLHLKRERERAEAQQGSSRSGQCHREFHIVDQEDRHWRGVRDRMCTSQLSQTALS